jgi:hypothetical protein
MGIQGSRARRFVVLAATGALIVGAVAGCGETSSGSDGSGNSGAKAGDASATTAKGRGTLKPSLHLRRQGSTCAPEINTVELG